MGLTHKGVNYDVGTNYLPDGALSRQTWRGDLMRQEIRAIRDELHCTSVTVNGTDIDRLVETATVAVQHGLHVWLQPRLYDAGPQRTFAHLAQAARAAEKLRSQYSAVELSIGCELSVFSTGIMPGATFAERSAKLASPVHWPLFPWYNRRLNRFLRSAVQVARADFGGRITYGAGLWESVDWSPFDVIGLNYYRLPYNRFGYVAKLRRLKAHGRPIIITEFGNASFEGSTEMGPSAHGIIDHSGPESLIPGSYVRNERIQAEQIAELIEIYETEDLHGAFVFEFIEPEHPHSADSRRDLDMAGYGVVKVLPGDQGAPYRWEPKEAFHEIARRYRPAD